MDRALDYWKDVWKHSQNVDCIDYKILVSEVKNKCFLAQCQTCLLGFASFWLKSFALSKSLRFLILCMKSKLKIHWKKIKK
jgi:hypothetical protein